MDIRITGLSAAPFARLFSMTDEELARHRAIRRFAVEKPGCPCRVSLEDAEIGEEVVLVHHQHHAVDTPYRASHAIFVRAVARQTYDAVNDIPGALRTRLLSVRAFDDRGLMVAADLTEGHALVQLCERLFADPQASYLHAHFARAGCYAARIERA